MQKILPQYLVFIHVALLNIKCINNLFKVSGVNLTGIKCVHLGGKRGSGTIVSQRMDAILGLCSEKNPPSKDHVGKKKKFSSSSGNEGARGKKEKAQSWRRR